MSQIPYFCVFNSHIPYFLHYLILIYHTFQKYGISDMNLLPLLITLLQACIMEALVPTHTSNCPSLQLLFLFRSLCLRNMATPLQIGDTFPDILAAKNAIHGFMASNAESFKTAHSDKTRVILLCKLDGCSFRIRGFYKKKMRVSHSPLGPHFFFSISY